VTSNESATILPGDRVVTAEVAGHVVGLTICYDLRFPELYRLLALDGAELILVPAAFTLYTGKDHWHTLLRARAIENQCYVAAPAQIGPHDPGQQCYGHSLVADPWEPSSPRRSIMSVWLSRRWTSPISAKYEPSYRRWPIADRKPMEVSL
jgi:predicted amidohydrolase